MKKKILVRLADCGSEKSCYEVEVGNFNPTSVATKLRKLSKEVYSEIHARWLPGWEGLLGSVWDISGKYTGFFYPEYWERSIVDGTREDLTQKFFDSLPWEELRHFNLKEEYLSQKYLAVFLREGNLFRVLLNRSGVKVDPKRIYNYEEAEFLMTTMKEMESVSPLNRWKTRIESAREKFQAMEKPELVKLLVRAEVAHFGTQLNYQ